MKMPTPSVLLDGLVFPECPRWHDGNLWLSDMQGQKVLRVNLEGRSEVVASVPQRPAGLGFLPDGRLLVVSMADRLLLRLDPDGLHPLADLSSIVTGDLNDMVVDAEGRAYIGNFGFDLFAGAPRKPTNLVMVAPDGRAQVVADGLEFPNGMVISPDGKTLIVAETFGNRLTAFDIDRDGSLSGRQVFAELGRVTPDGICLDAGGAVWVSSPSTSEFLRVTKGGAVTHRTPVPGKGAIACMLGGEDRRTLFLCTGRATGQDIAQGRSVGWVETVRVEVPGAGRP